MADIDHRACGGWWIRSGIRHPAALVMYMLIAGTNSGVLIAATCADSSGSAAVDTCGAQLSQNPGDLKIRHALAAALMKLGRYQEAIDVLKRGLAMSPGEESLQSDLAKAQSFLEEQAWIARQRETGASTENGSTDIAAKLDKIRCSKLQGDAALAACNSGLVKLPDDVALLTGKADALLSLNRIPEAITAYRRALAQEPGNGETQGKLRAAESKRQIAVAKCMKLDGAAGLAACNGSVLKGAKDQAAIEARRGDILVGMRQPAKALDAYKAAQKLDRENARVRKAILALETPAPSESRQVPAGEPVVHATDAIESKHVQVEAPPAVTPVLTIDAQKADSTPGGTTVAAERIRYSNAPLSQGVTY